MRRLNTFTDADTTADISAHVAFDRGVHQIAQRRRPDRIDFNAVPEPAAGLVLLGIGRPGAPNTSTREPGGSGRAACRCATLTPRRGGCVFRVDGRMPTMTCAAAAVSKRQTGHLVGPSTGRFDIGGQRLVTPPIRGRAGELKVIGASVTALVGGHGGVWSAQRFGLQSRAVRFPGPRSSPSSVWWIATAVPRRRGCVQPKTRR